MIRALGRDRSHWLTLAAAIAACNGVAAPVLGAAERMGPLAALANTGGINPVFWFAILVALVIAFEPEAEQQMTRGDCFVVAVVFALALTPVVSAGSAGVLLAGGAELDERQG